MPKTKDVECSTCGAVVTLNLNGTGKRYNGECPGCEKRMESKVSTKK